MTKIEWVKNPDGSQGITVNSKTGCLNHTPEGLCLGGGFPCYAYRLANGRLRQRYFDNHNVIYDYDDLISALEDIEDPFYPRFWPERLEQVRHRKKPTGIFLDDMSDWMGDYWPEEWTELELQTMRGCPQHRFYTLTKQPQNLIKWEFPDNCWVGVTATNHDGFLGAINRLRVIKATVKFISFEPLMKEIPFQHQAFYYAGINWVILGAQTKPYKPPNPLWVHEIIVACREAGIPYFLKNNLAECLPVEAPYYRMPGYLIQKEGFSYEIDKPILIQEMPK